MDSSNLINIYTDGACSGNPGPGGWGIYIDNDGAIKEISGSEDNTTNNRMELKAVIEALKYFTSKANLKLHTDSKYVKDGITTWINSWEKNNWKTADKKNVKNVDLWRKLKELTQSNSIEWNWVKGHSEDPMNDLADKLAKRATPV